MTLEFPVGHLLLYKLQEDFLYCKNNLLHFQHILILKAFAALLSSSGDVYTDLVLYIYINESIVK